MRLIQLCYGFIPRQNAVNGGELRYWQDFAALIALGHEVHILIIGVDIALTEIEEQIVRAAASVHIVPSSKPDLSRLDWWAVLASSQAIRKVFFSEGPELAKIVHQIIDQIRPDLVWACLIGAMNLVPQGYPAVYSHADFLYKVRQVRNNMRHRSARQRMIDVLRETRLKRYELSVACQAHSIACVSHSEKKELEALGAKYVTYIPIVSETIPAPDEHSDAGRIFVFGTWANTAMRSSMKHFQAEIWPLLEKSPANVEWHQVGNPETHVSEVWQWVQQNFHCHGFVSDLASVFKIGDACILPYKDNTGFRTRFVIAAGYGVVNIGYYETFLCVPEFTPGKNCLAGNTPAEIAELIRSYASDPALRKRLGEASRALYASEFSFEAQIPKYAEVVANALKK